jgi:Lamin Tail Domain
MKNVVKIRKFWLMIFLLLSLVVISPLHVSAISPPSPTVPPGLSVAQIKITGDEFVVLQNNAGAAIPDLSVYWLYDFNNVSPLAPGVSSSQQQLPAVSLDAGQTLVLSASSRDTCGAEVAGKLSLSLTDSSGFLEIVQLGQDSSGAVQQKSGDMVSWSSGASGIIQNMPGSTKDPQGMYYRYQNGSNYAWQLADLTATACQLAAITAPNTPAQPVSTLAAASDLPPVTIINTAEANDSAPPALPAADIGLSAPQINELLPNPSGTANDGTDEFIELYNPNSAVFDLSGFVLQTGITTKHSYVFPAATTLLPKSFTAYYSSDTGLSLSNTSGQAFLLDPLGNTIGRSDPYGSAKDGAAWAVAKGVWLWTTNPTPNSANVIKQATTTSKKSSTSKATSTSKSNTAVKGASTTGSPNSSTGSAAQVANMTPIHPWTLAIVAVLAVAYGVYEYRFDLANRLYEFRRHHAAGIRAWLPFARRRSYRADQ